MGEGGVAGSECGEWGRGEVMVAVHGVVMIVEWWGGWRVGGVGNGVRCGGM